MASSPKTACGKCPEATGKPLSPLGQARASVVKGILLRLPDGVAYADEPDWPWTERCRYSEVCRLGLSRLHHTNIVPVFGVGEEGGLHYYAMQSIQGLGLDEVLNELRRLSRTPGGVLAQLCSCAEGSRLLWQAATRPHGRGSDSAANQPSRGRSAVPDRASVTCASPWPALAPEPRAPLRLVPAASAPWSGGGTPWHPGRPHCPSGPRAGATRWPPRNGRRDTRPAPWSTGTSGNNGDSFFRWLDRRVSGRL